MKAVNAGEVDGGIIYHYYWFRDQAKTKEISGNTALHYFKNEDPGAFVSLSGGGVLKSSKKQDQAQQFLKFITGKAGQEVLREGHLVRVPGGQRRAREPRPAAARHAAGAGGGPVDAGRAEGVGPDDEGWACYRWSLPRFRAPTAPVSRSDAAARPGPLVTATVAILVAATFIPLGYVGVGGGVHRAGRSAYELVVRPRVGELLFNTVAPGRRHGAAVCGHRCRRGLAGGADRPARPGVLASVVRRAACRSGVRQQLRVGRRDPVAARAVGGRA